MGKNKVMLVNPKDLMDKFLYHAEVGGAMMYIHVKGDKYTKEDLENGIFKDCENLEEKEKAINAILDFQNQLLENEG